MGIVHASCQATGLGITSRVWASVRVIVVAERDGVFEPVALPIYGDYDDHGKIEKPILLDGDRAFARGLLDMHARGELSWSDTAEITTDVSESNLVAILEEIRQGMIYEAVRPREAPSQLMRVGPTSLHFVHVLDDFYERVSSMQRQALSAEERDAIDEEQEGPFDALTRVLGVPSLSARFVADTSSVRDELVGFRLFRSWFDAHRTWRPSSIGEQLSASDLRARATSARGSLAEWPPLVATLDRYVERLGSG